MRSKLPGWGADLLCECDHELVLFGSGVEKVWQQLLPGTLLTKRQCNGAQAADAVEFEGDIVIPELITAVTIARLLKLNPRPLHHVTSMPGL